MPILDQFGRPIIRYVRRTDLDLDAEVAAELNAEQEARMAAEREADEAKGTSVSGLTKLLAEADEAQARKAEIEAARASGKAEGIAEGKKAGRKAVCQRMRDIVAGAHGNGALAQSAIELALEASDISAAVALSIARHAHRGSASLANRHLLPNSLDRAMTQLAQEGA